MMDPLEGISGQIDQVVKRIFIAEKQVPGRFQSQNLTELCIGLSQENGCPEAPFGPEGASGISLVAFEKFLQSLFVLIQPGLPG